MRERLRALLESYDAALAELYAWNDPMVTDLISRLEAWRAAVRQEVLFLDSPRPAAAKRLAVR
jgi:hypothetical protein